MNNRKTGDIYELYAMDYLKSHGVLILYKNFRCKIGEIDIIGLDGDTLVFFEVKFRKTSKNGYPSEAVSKTKQATICKVADYYRLKNGISALKSCRFDVVSITGTKDDIVWYKNAFEYKGTYY